jgi:sialic acid synthase SpsE
MNTFVIAEAGSNHNKSLEQAYALVDVAKESGAQAVKFQIFSSKTLYAENTPNFAGYGDINALMKTLELPREWVPKIKEYCDKKNIEFMATPFDEEAIQQLCDVGVKRMKIAGFESTDLRFVEMVAATKLPLIISAGIGCHIDFIQEIIDTCHKQDNYDITILHCNNAYPTPQEDINLLMVKDILEKYGKQGVKVGLSDHTMSTITPALAVMVGATTIEKHFTISNKLPGPDHPFAMEPNDLKKMNEEISLAELSLKRKKSEYTDSEKDFKMARRSVISKEEIKKGQELTQENITTSRPFLEGAVPASSYREIIGSKTLRDIAPGTVIRREDLG